MTDDAGLSWLCFRQAHTDLDRLQLEEATVKNDLREMERKMALLKHEMKEVIFKLLFKFYASC